MLFYDGKYEDYLEFFGSLKIDFSWNHFQLVQNRLKNATKSLGVHEKKCQVWIPHIATFFLLYSKKLHQQDQKATCLWQDYLHSIAMDKTQMNELSSLVEAVFQINNLDLLIQLTLSDKKSKGLFESLKILPEEALDIAFFLYFLKAVHEQNLYDNQEAYLAFFECLEDTRRLILNTNLYNKENILKIFFQAKASQLGLDLKSPLSVTITYLSALIGVKNADEAKDLKQGLLELSPDDLAIILEIFEEKDPVYLRFEELRHFLLYLFSHPHLAHHQHKLKLQNFVKYALPIVVKVIAQNKRMTAKKELDPAAFIQFDPLQFHLPTEVTLWPKIQPTISKEGIIAIH